MYIYSIYVSEGNVLFFLPSYIYLTALANSYFHFTYENMPSTYKICCSVVG